jgi:hypothetical protein
MKANDPVKDQAIIHRAACWPKRHGVYQTTIDPSKPVDRCPGFGP